MATRPAHSAQRGVSVIIPTYNRAHCVMDAVRSAVEQDPPPLEVIVVDDGSTDETRALFANGGHPLVRYHRQENQGVSAARNAGLRMARGDLAAFLDSDDVWLPGKLAAQEKVLRSDPECALVFADMREVVQGRTRYESFLNKGFANVAEGYLYEALLQGNFIATPTVMLRIAAVMACGCFDEGLRYSEDRDLWLRLAETGRFRMVEQVLCVCHRDGDGLTSDIGGWMGNQLAMFTKHLHRRRTTPLGPIYADRNQAVLRKLEDNVHTARTMLGRHCTRSLELARARALLREGLRYRFSAEDLKYLVAAHLPVPVLRGLKEWRARSAARNAQAKPAGGRA
jgi:glycosyltransferase involved in cell wall biosynthesis